MTTNNTYQIIVSRNRRGVIRDFVTGLLLAVGVISGTSALTTTRLPNVATMDAMLRANPMPDGDRATWACGTGDVEQCSL